MPRFVLAHLLDDRTALGVRFRQALDVPGEVLLDLALGLDDEREIGAVAPEARGEPDGERAGVLKRVQ